ncbi:MAG TPA: 30S ribosomal protein S6 [Solirubrobacterales bacterium]|jgi:small subunit ribosomal protein S6
MVAGYSPSPLLAATREYELVLMLDAGQDSPSRDALAQQAKAQIEGGGTLKHENNWGLRKLAYEISQRTEADYRWFRFEATPDLLQELDHNLKITDGVLRFRIFKVDPDAPVVVPPATAAPGPESSRERPPAPPRAAPQPPPPAAEAESAVAESAPEAAAEPAGDAAPAEGEPAPESADDSAAE